MKPTVRTKDGHRKLREHLFRNNKPHIRNLSLIDDNGISKDVKILWVAHKNKPFPFLNHVKTQEGFLKEIVDASQRLPFYVVEDINSEYDGNMGLIGLIASKEDGWKIEPHIEFFPWATKRNILRTCISFFQMVRYSRKIGVCVIRSLKESANLFDRCSKYFPVNVFYKVGKIPNGDIRGDEFIYCISGRKNK